MSKEIMLPGTGDFPQTQVEKAPKPKSAHKSEPVYEQHEEEEKDRVHVAGKSFYEGASFREVPQCDQTQDDATGLDESDS